jgi:RNA recognition motif-containing protein
MDNKRKERTTLFVGDLSSVCTETDLEQAFSVYGQVQQVRIQRNRMTMASMAYGFVRMTNPVESINAKNALDGTLLCGRKLRVREAEYGVGGADKGFLRKYSLYIKFESTEEGKKTNEVKIRDIFSQYGEVSDISLRKIFFDKHTGLQKGYGFIHFSNSSEGIQASFNVIADIPQIIVDGVIYVIEASNNLKSRIDAIVQDTPEAADELSDAKAFIMNSGNNNNNHGRGGNRNNGYNQNQGGYGGGRGHRNRNHNVRRDRVCVMIC